MTQWATVVSVFVGSLAGTFLGPVLLDEWRTAKSMKQKRRRMELIRELFGAVEAPVLSLEDVRIACGADVDAARELLIEMGARGTTMTNGQEGWFFDRTRTKFSATNIDQ